jgi:hypothetical protein
MKETDAVKTLELSWAFLLVPFTTIVAFDILILIESYWPSGSDPKATDWVEFTAARSTSIVLFETDDHPDGSPVSALCALISAIVTYTCSAVRLEEGDNATATLLLASGG